MGALIIVHVGFKVMGAVGGFSLAKRSAFWHSVMSYSKALGVSTIAFFAFIAGHEETALGADAIRICSFEKVGEDRGVYLAICTYPGFLGLS
jgi:hypothetical protein